MGLVVRTEDDDDGLRVISRSDKVAERDRFALLGENGESISFRKRFLVWYATEGFGKSLVYHDVMENQVDYVTACEDAGNLDY